MTASVANAATTTGAPRLKKMAARAAGQRKSVSLN